MILFSRNPCAQQPRLQLYLSGRFGHRANRSCCTRRRLSVNSELLTATPAEEQCIREINRLGFPTSILPAAGEGREAIDALVSQLEASSPTPEPLSGGAGSGANPLLFGSWRLVYASNGTVVTRTGAAQALVAASALPGVGLRNVQQDLQLADGEITTSNSAVFGLGPLGEWDATIYGSWEVESSTLARVAFLAYSVQLLGFFGWRPLQEAFKLRIPLPEAARQRKAEFKTTYLSQQLRVARGSTGNVFVFTRK